MARASVTRAIAYDDVNLSSLLYYARYQPPSLAHLRNNALAITLAFATATVASLERAGVTRVTISIISSATQCAVASAQRAHRHQLARIFAYNHIATQA